MGQAFRGSEAISAVFPEDMPNSPAFSGETVIWLRVEAPDCKQGIIACLKELGEPDFLLDSCQESAQLSADHARYSAHWMCRFLSRTVDPIAGVRLLRRLAGAGFDILRYDAPVLNS